jgi:hypothetical protein
MKTRFLMLAVFLATAVAAKAGPAYDITVSKDTVDQRKSEWQERYDHSRTRLIATDLRYVFSLKRLSLKQTGPAEVQWIVLVEKATGRLTIGAVGNEALPDPGESKTAEIRTATIALTARETQSSTSSRSVEDSVFGYAVRVVTEDGKVLAEKYSSTSMRKRVNWEHPHESCEARPAAG